MRKQVAIFKNKQEQTLGEVNLDEAITKHKTTTKRKQTFAS